MSAAGGGNSGAFSGTGSCTRQMVHGRHSLPCADTKGCGDGRRQRGSDAASAGGVRQPFGFGVAVDEFDDRHCGVVAIAIAGRYPDRFVPLGTVPFQAPDFAVAELDRIHKSLGFRGIEIATNVAGEDFSAERFRKIFARIEEFGLLIFMHPTGFPEARRFADHYLVNVIGNPLDSTVALHHLIFGGVLHDYPNLKLVIAHGGGYLPAYSGRIDHAAAARPDCCEKINRMPTTYLKRLYFDTIVFTHHQLEYLVEQYGADHVLVGTDYPADMGEVDPIGFIEGARGLDDNERRAILGGNAARLLSIEIPGRPE
ncbi:MAG: hypothetical protein E6G83_10670 [Alphaproteobacteria bacterium]|nr:MAG: hypothetical protein E6G83_10670 [Alphaproteobacteria bacterium]